VGREQAAPFTNAESNSTVAKLILRAGLETAPVRQPVFSVIFVGKKRFAQEGLARILRSKFCMASVSGADDLSPSDDPAPARSPLHPSIQTFRMILTRARQIAFFETGARHLALQSLPIMAERMTSAFRAGVNGCFVGQITLYVHQVRRVVMMGE
jgi:hypothetical protein